MQPGLRNASGLALGWRRELWFWFAYLALLAASWLLLIAAVLIRLPDLLGFYFFEALLALCAPLLVLYVCDSQTLRSYGMVWHDLLELNRAELLLSTEAVELVRRELRHNPLLRWLRPPPSRSIAGQLLTASLWYHALLAPEGSGFLRRYREQLLLALGYCLLLSVPLGWVYAHSSALFTPRLVNALGAAGCGLMLGLFGLQQLAVLARRQAIDDFFALHAGSEGGADGEPRQVSGGPGMGE